MSKDLKIAICFGLIMGALISFCNMCFATEIEDITPSIVSNIAITTDGQVTSGTGSAGYITIEPGYIYHFQNNLNSNIRVVGFSNKIIEPGDTLSDVSVVQPQGTYDFTYSDFSYVYFNSYLNTSITITREPLEGMSNFIDQLSYSLTNDGIYETFLACVPLLVLGVLFGLGVFFIVRLIYGIIKIRGVF